MRHWPTFPDMAVHPQPAIHGVNHPRSTRPELAIRDLTLWFVTAMLVGRPHGQRRRRRLIGRQGPLPSPLGAEPTWPPCRQCTSGDTTADASPSPPSPPRP